MNTPENDSDVADLDEFSDAFKCCVCLDLIYKPIVLACGHILCFWCVFKSMDTWQESRCPVCRQSYYHFPSICWLLHSVLLKLYPKSYQRRESQVMEEEKTYGTSSPQFEKYVAVSHSSESLESARSDNNCNKIPASSNDEIIKNLTVEGNSLSGSNHVEGCNTQVAITDVLCRICEDLLYRPVVLNCGHVFCQVCIVGFGSSHEPCRCPVCQSMHPNGVPRVSLVLEGFLEQHVSKEYAAKRVAIEKVRTFEQGKTSTGSSQVPQGGQCSPVPMDEHVCSSGHQVHFGVGCDSCGMYPLIGDRYKCMDCSEQIGFDLCEDCFKSSSNLPGKFNQQHKPEHKFAVIEFIVTHSDEDDAPDNPEDQTDVEGDVTGPVPTNDTLGDHDDGDTGSISSADP